MENYVKEQTNKTPFIKFDIKRGILYMKGQLMDEHPKDTLTALEKFVDKFLSSPTAITSIILDINYLNTAASKYLFDILYRLGHSKNTKTNATWILDEDDDDFAIDVTEILKISNMDQIHIQKK